MKKYKVTITEVRTVRKKVKGEWTTIDTEEVDRTDTFRAHSPDSEPTRIKDIKGYAPDVEKDIEETNTVYEQQLDELCVPSVIAAVNQYGHDKTEQPSS